MMGFGQISVQVHPGHPHPSGCRVGNDCLFTRPLTRPPSVLGSRESLATLSELDLGAERDVRIWPLHPSLLEEPHCFQVVAGSCPPDLGPLTPPSASAAPWLPLPDR